MDSAAGSVSASGFSHSTARPRSSASVLTSAWASGIVTLTTASASTRSSSSSSVVATAMSVKSASAAERRAVSRLRSARPTSRTSVNLPITRSQARPITPAPTWTSRTGSVGESIGCGHVVSFEVVGRWPRKKVAWWRGLVHRAASGGGGCLPDVLPARGEFGGATAGQHEAGFAGDAAAGDVKRGTVVDGNADDGEADGDVDAFVAVHRFERSVALVVVAGDDDVPLAADGGRDECVGWDRAMGVDASITRPCDRWLEDVGVLVAEDAVLTGVWVEPADAYGFVRLAQGAGEGASEGEDIVGPLRGAVLDGLLQKIGRAS